MTRKLEQSARVTRRDVTCRSVDVFPPEQWHTTALELRESLLVIVDEQWKDVRHYAVRQDREQRLAPIPATKGIEQGRVVRAPARDETSDGNRAKQHS